ncbi:hypothetical protein [Amycolatopsis cihanbeyliensis]|nr:hypothetical protein [Amycolatopsis cihanbeyliensis]
MPIDMNPNGGRVGLRYTEGCALVGTILAAVFLRPRFWEWDRTGTRRATFCSVAFAVAGMAIAPFIITLSFINISAPAALDEIGMKMSEILLLSILNTSFLAALIFSLSPFIGPTSAGVTALLCWFSTGILNNLVPPSMNYTPTIAYRLPLPDQWPADRWWYPVVLGFVAIVTHAVTRGSTSFAQRTFVRDG